MMVPCQLCNRTFKQITLTHLRSHGINLAEYQEQFPDAELVSQEIKDRISQKNKGRERTAEHKANLSASIRKGFENGRMAQSTTLGRTDSDATREKKRLARLGKKHSQDTKDKIGDAHRGKTMTPQAIEKQKASRKLAEERNGGGFATGPRSDEFKEKMSQIAKNRAAAEYGAKVQAMWDARRGSKATPEQRERYREARLKFMAENPQKVRDTAGEKEIKEWLEINGIEFSQQYSITKGGHPYDFYLPKYHTLLEFDGTHHWDRIWFNVADKTDDEKFALLENQMEKDAIENKLAGDAGYKIIRVRGWAKVGDTPEYGTLEEQMLGQGFIK